MLDIDMFRGVAIADRSCLCHVCSDHRSSGLPATIAAVGGLMIPAMIDPPSEVVFYGAGSQWDLLGILIPKHPNDSLYTTIAGVSVSKLFAAGMLPGLIVVGVFLNLYCYLLVLFISREAEKTEHTDRWKKTLKSF